MMYWVEVVEPDAPTLQPPVKVYAVLAPAHVTATVATAAVPVPVLVRVRYAADAVLAQVKVVVPVLVLGKLAAISAVPVTAICAEFWPWAKIPKTNPPIATEAMRVTAIMSTVAMIGEIAFLGLLADRIFMLRLSFRPE